MDDCLLWICYKQKPIGGIMKNPIKSVKDAIKTVSGTCGEAYQNGAYNKLKEITGSEARADDLVLPYLQERGITLPQWRCYQDVKTVMQRNPPPIDKVVKEIKDLAKKAVDDEFGA